MAEINDGTEDRTDAEAGDSQLVRIIAFNQVMSGLLPATPNMVLRPGQDDAALKPSRLPLMVPMLDPKQQKHPKQPAYLLRMAGTPPASHRTTTPTLSLCSTCVSATLIISPSYRITTVTQTEELPLRVPEEPAVILEVSDDTVCGREQETQSIGAVAG